MNNPWKMHLPLLVAFTLFAGTGRVGAAVLTVEQDGSGQFTTIHAALAAANSYDEIRVGPGQYRGPIHVSKPGLIVAGTNREDCVVSLESMDGNAGLWVSSAASAAAPIVRNLTLMSVLPQGYQMVEDDVGIRIENCTLRPVGSSSANFSTSPFRSTYLIESKIIDIHFVIRGPRQVIFEDSELAEQTWIWYANSPVAPGSGSFRFTRCVIGASVRLSFGGELPYGIFDSTFESGMTFDRCDLTISGTQFGGEVIVSQANVTLERSTVLAEATAFRAEAGSQIIATDVTFESLKGSSLVLSGDSILDATRLRLFSRATEAGASEANVVIDGSQMTIAGGVLQSDCDFQMFLTGYYRVQVSGVQFTAGRVTTIHALSWGPLTIRGSHILFGPGRAASFGPTVPGILNPDLRENYWGTADLTAIADAIYDGNDFGCPTCAIVLFEPIASGPVEASPSSFGALKAAYDR